MNPHEAQYNVFAATHDAMPGVPKTHVVAAFDAAWSEFTDSAVFVCGQSDRDREREFKRINRKVRDEVNKVYPVGFLDVWGWFQLIRLVAMVVRLVWEHKRDAAHT